MQSRLHWFLFLLVCGFAVLPLVGTSHVRAAEGSSANLYNIDTSQFPLISAFLYVGDADGLFVPGLRSSQITLVEDGKALPASQLDELNPGAQFVVAINPGRPFAIRDGLGFSRYDLLLEAFGRWSQAYPDSSIDDLSLLVTDGPEALHLTSAQDWYNSLLSYDGDLRDAVPSLEVLDLSLEVASEPTSQPGMGRGILFITPPLEGGMAVGLQNIASRARQAGVRISVWMVASPESFVSPSATELQGLAEQTGGRYFAYSGTEPVPDLDLMIEPLRSVYQLAYHSKINTSGVHQLLAEVQSNETPASSSMLTFDLVVQPPKAIFVSPPSLIERVYQTAPRAEQQAESLPASYLPKEQELEIIVDFPDGFAREILTTTLYIDGAPVLIQTDPPFERLAWDLSSYTTSGSHLIRVEIIDELGLMASTVENSVELVVETPPRQALVDFSRKAPFVVILAVLLAGAVVVLVLVMLGKFSPQNLAAVIRPETTRRLATYWPPARFPNFYPSSRKTGPMPPPAPASEKDIPTGGNPGRWVNRLHWPQRTSTPLATAYLTPLVIKEDEKTLVPIPILDGENYLGRDPHQATVLVDDPSVELLHARICPEGDSFRIFDEGSIAGTWVNYTPISREGVLLEHSDLVHIGKVGFRFTRREPGHVKRPVVRPEERE